MPLIPAANSYNRNFVLTMGHTGVKFIIDAIGLSITNKIRDKHIAEGKINRPDGPTVLNPELKALASNVGLKGLNASMKLYDPKRSEEKQKKVTVSSDAPKVQVATADEARTTSKQEQLEADLLDEEMSELEGPNIFEMR
jgi:hypothetical protein